jgi:hypothetical protein
MNAAHSLCTKRFAAYLFLDEQHKELAMKCFVLLVAAVLAPCALSATTRYVGPAGTPGGSYYTSIQAAVDASSAGDTVVVSNGVYASGARVTPGYASSNRVVITKAIHVRSAGGPAGTVIMGQGPFGSNAVRCVRMTAGTLEGFTLSNGYTRLGGQGDWDHDRCGGGINAFGGTAVVVNCILSGNRADRGGGGANYGIFSNCIFYGNAADSGGGARYGTLHRCTLVGNTADSGGGAGNGIADCCLFFSNRVTTSGGGTSWTDVRSSLYRWNRANSAGGGAGGGTLYNCTLVDNWAAGAGGGVDWSTMFNCIVWSNVAAFGSNFFHFSASYSCSEPFLPGVGNISNDPLFVYTATGDYHLLEISPCVDTGTNLPWMAGATDLDGNPRSTGGRIDMGCYEYIPEPGAAVLLAVLMAIHLVPSAKKWRPIRQSKQN